MIAWIALCVSLFLAGVMCGLGLKKGGNAPQVPSQDESKPNGQWSHSRVHADEYIMPKKPRPETPNRPSVGDLEKARNQRRYGVVSEFASTKEPDYKCAKCGLLADRICHTHDGFEIPYCNKCEGL